MKRGIPQREEILVSEGTCGGASWRVFRQRDCRRRNMSAACAKTVSRAVTQVALARLAREADEQDAQEHTEPEQNQ